MILNCVSVAVQANDVETTSAVQTKTEGFEDDVWATTGDERWNVWPKDFVELFNWQSKYYAEVKADEKDAQNKAVFVDLNATKTRWIKLKTSALTSLPSDGTGTLTYEFRIRFPEENIKSGDSPVTAYAGYNASAEGTKKVATLDADKTRVDGNNQKNYNESKNEWRTLKFVYNLSAHTYDLYSDGDQVCDDISYGDDNSWIASGMLLRCYGNANTGNTADWWVDDVKVAYVASEPEMISGISIGGKAIENFAYGTKNYTVEIPSDVYESLNESNVAVTKTSDYSDAAITTTVGEETEGTKTVTVKVSSFYSETTYTIVCTEKVSAALTKTEGFEGSTWAEWMDVMEWQGTKYATIEDDPSDETDKALKMTLTSTSHRYADVKGATALPQVPESRTAGRMIYTFKIYFPELADEIVNNYPATLYVGSHESGKGKEIGSLRSTGAKGKSDNRVSFSNVKKWYEVKSIYDYATTSYTWYADGQLVEKDIKMEDYDPYTSGIRVRITSDGTNENTVYLDDVKVEYVELAVDNVVMTTVDGKYFDTDNLPEIVKITVSGANVRDNEIYVILSGYKNGVLEYIYIQPCLWKASHKSFEQTFDIGKNADFDTIKAFVWRDLSCLIPLSQPIIKSNAYGIDVEFVNGSSAYGGGKVYIKSHNSQIGTCQLYWEDDNGVMENHKPVATVSLALNCPETVVTLNENLMIPDGAKYLVAYINGELFDKYIIPDNKKFDTTLYGEKLYSFGQLSDVHLPASDTAPTKFRNALDYFFDNNCEFVSICGDILQNNKIEELSLYKQITDEYEEKIPIYVSVGNHDAISTIGEEVWAEHVQYPEGQNPLYFEVIQDKGTVDTSDDDVFLYMGMNNWSVNEPFTKDEIDWLKIKLEKYKNNTVFLNEHIFFEDTVGDLLYNGNWVYGTSGGGVITSPITYGDSTIDLKALLEQYDNVIHFSGHSHFGFEVQKFNPTLNIYVGKNGYTAVHVPSCGRLAKTDSLGSKRITDDSGSQGFIVDVYENYVVLRGLDLVNDEIVSEAVYILNK